MLNDWSNMPEEMLQKIAEVRGMLDVTEKGLTRQSIQNCKTALEQDPLLAGAIRWNVLTEKIDIVKNLGWYRDDSGLSDSDLSHIMLYLEIFYGLTSEKLIGRALDVVVAKNHYHPIRDYLNALEWDGTPRLRHALHYFLGADESELTYECLKVFMLGAAHRVFDPGCKMEFMLCLVGEQGVGKSSFFRFLALKDAWFTDDLKKLDDENVYRKMQGHWIIEMAEMLGTASAKSVEEIKSFLSRQEETYKTPYAKYAQGRKRQCVFVGTSNKQRFLPLDRTGNRRFLPIRVCHAEAETHVLENSEETRRYMDQLWAELMVIYKRGEWSLKLPDELNHQLDILRLEFMAEDTLTGVIQSWLDDFSGDYVCTKMLYEKALKQFGEPDRKAIGEINDIMNNTIKGWLPGPSSHRFGHKYGTQRAWHRESVNEPLPDANSFAELTGAMEQQELPEEWLK